MLLEKAFIEHHSSDTKPPERILDMGQNGIICHWTTWWLQISWKWIRPFSPPFSPKATVSRESCCKNIPPIALLTSTDKESIVQRFGGGPAVFPIWTCGFIKGLRPVLEGLVVTMPEGARETESQIPRALARGIWRTVRTSPSALWQQTPTDRS